VASGILGRGRCYRCSRLLDSVEATFAAIKPVSFAPIGVVASGVFSIGDVFSIGGVFSVGAIFSVGGVFSVGDVFSVAAILSSSTIFARFAIVAGAIR
jgi:hypothetical protein